MCPEIIGRGNVNEDAEFLSVHTGTGQNLTITCLKFFRPIDFTSPVVAAKGGQVQDKILSLSYSNRYGSASDLGHNDIIINIILSLSYLIKLKFKNGPAFRPVAPPHGASSAGAGCGRCLPLLRRRSTPFAAGSAGSG